METFSKNAFHVDPELPCSQQSCEPAPGAVSRSAVGEHVAGGSSHPETHRARARQGCKGPEDGATSPSGRGRLPQLSREGLAWSRAQAAWLPRQGLCVPIRMTVLHPGSAWKADAVSPKSALFFHRPRELELATGRKGAGAQVRPELEARPWLFPGV